MSLIMKKKKQDFLNHHKLENEKEILEKIFTIEKELKMNALENFYRLVKNEEVEIFKEDTSTVMD